MLIVGLGNPGEQYKNTRHNVGFLAVDAFAEKNNFPEFELQKKSNALVSESGNILLAKPQTFMNDSGKAVKEICKNKIKFCKDGVVCRCGGVNGFNPEHPRTDVRGIVAQQAGAKRYSHSGRGEGVEG